MPLKIKKLNSREKIILFLTMGLVIIFGINQGVIKPLRENSEDIAQRIEMNQKRLHRSLAVIEESKAIEGDYQKLVEIFGSAASEGMETSTMISKLETAAKQAGIHIANMQPQRSITKEPFIVFPVDLVIDGSWENITEFLQIVQAAPNLLNIEEINLEKFSDTTSALRGRLLLSRLRVTSPKK